MKYTVKPKTVDAIQWTGKNTEQAVAFLKEHGFPETRLERRPDTPLCVRVPRGELTVFKDQYIVIHSDGIITSVSEDYFEETYEKEG
jgi:hypothetical protein